MYEKLLPKQQNGMIYGFKLRLIGAIEGCLGQQQTTQFEAFTQAEYAQIKEICNNAKIRAKTFFEETRDQLDRKSEVSSGSETEHRTYSGK